MKVKQFLKNIFPYVVAILLVVLFRAYIATPVRVSGQSMYPNLKGKEILLLSKLSDFERYDIIVLDRNVSKDHLVKRVYGLPGETIKAKDNKLYINDKKIADDYGYGVTSDFGPTKLGKDEYFVLGDNRIISLDSRGIGAIKKNQISGKIVFSLFPFKKIK